MNKYNQNIFQQFSANQRQIIKELFTKKYEINIINKTNIVNFQNNIFHSIMIGSYTEAVPYNIGLIISNKNFVKKILKKNYLQVAEGRLFECNEIHEALLYMKKIKAPLILRQENSQKNIKSEKVVNDWEFKDKYIKLAKYNENILVEKFHFGNNYRVFYTKNGYINILQRFNNAYYLQEDKLNESIVYKEINLRGLSFLKIIAEKIINSFPGVKYIAFDFICTEELVKLNKKNYIITEVYPSYGQNINFFMYKGRIKRRANKIVVDLLT